MNERYKKMSIVLDADTPRSQDVLFDTRTMLMLVIDDGNQRADNEGYVSLLDGSVLYDRGVLSHSQANEIIVAQSLSSDDYVKSVIWDSPYAIDNDIARGTSWMKGVNEFLKTINSSNG